MAQKTSWNGATLTESDINTYLMGEGGAWSTWTPAITQSGSVAATTSIGRFARYGRTIHFRTRLTVTGAGTASNVITVTLPVTSASSTGVIGSGYLFDASSSFYYPFIAIQGSTTIVNFLSSATTGSASVFLGSSVFTVALAASDVIEFSGSYEAAT